MVFLDPQDLLGLLVLMEICCQLGIRPLLGHKGLLVLRVSLAHKVHLDHQAIEMTSVQTSRSTFKVFPSEAHLVPLVLLGLRVPLVKSMDWFRMQSMATERGSKQNNKNLLKMTTQEELCLDCQVHLALLDPQETRESQVCPAPDHGAWVMRTTPIWLAK